MAAVTDPATIEVANLEVKPTSEYDHSSLVLEEPIEEEAPAESPPESVKEPEPAPATEAKVEPPTLPKINHPRSLVRRAMEFGATREQISAASIEDLDDFVERNESVQPKAKEPEKKAEAAPDEIDELEKDLLLDPKISAFLRKERKEKEALKGTVASLAERDQARERSASYDAWDAGFAALGETGKKRYGDGPGEATSEKDQARRNVILRASGIQPGDRASVIAKKIKQADELLYGVSEEVKETPKVVPDPSKEPGYVNGKRFTDEQFKASTVAVPTQRKVKEPKGDKASEAAIAKMQKEQGWSQNFDSAPELNSVPD